MTENYEEQIETEVVVLTKVDTDIPKKASLMVQRSGGQVCRLSLYDKEGIDTEWVVGEKYELNSIGLKSRSDGGQYLTSDGEASVNRLTNDAFDLLVLGDTHLGYRNRTKNVDTRYINGSEFDVLEALIGLSEKWGIDGILHTGDLFDHKITQRGHERVMNLFRQLEDLDISVRFVRGNHDQRVKDRISSIRSLVNVDRLDQSTNWGSLGGFNIIGQGSDNFNEVSDFNWSGFESKYGGPNILIAHPKNIERDESVFEKLLKRIEKRWIVFFGHQHEEGRFDTERLRAIFTGFPAKTDDTGSVWRARGGNEYCRVTRHSLRNWTELY